MRPTRTSHEFPDLGSFTEPVRSNENTLNKLWARESRTWLGIFGAARGQERPEPVRPDLSLEGRPARSQSGGATRRWRAPRAPVLLSLAWLALVVLGSALAPVLAPEGPYAADSQRALLPPGQGALLGTDFLGRDVAARLLWGGRLTLAGGGLALATAIGLGLPVGLIAGSRGGWVDGALMRLVDAWLAFPSLLLAMAVLAVMGTGLWPVAIAVGLAAAPSYARVTRSVALEIRAQPYIEAARALGCSPLRIAVRHILVNAAPSLVAFAGAQLGWVLLTVGALNFLGLGVAPGTPEWGMMLADGRGYLRDAPWASLFPGLALTLTVLAANLAGDAWQETRT